jgi:predicted dehydrogenase
MTRLRVGLSGCGRLAEAGYLPALRGVPGLHLVAVADPDPERRALIADASGARPFSGLAELLDASELDALLVAGPAATHRGDASLASAAGIRSLVEKPPAATAADARAMAALEHAPWIGFNRRFSALAGLRDDVPEGGPVRLELTIRYRRRSWDPVSVKDDALGDLGPHLVDLALWLTAAEPVRVSAASLSSSRARMVLQTTRGQAEIACATDRPFLEVAAVRDPRGASRRIGGPLENVLTRIRRGESALVASLRAELRAYEAALRGERGEALASASDGVAVMAAIEAARTSAAAGRAVDVDILEPAGVTA